MSTLVRFCILVSSFLASCGYHFESEETPQVVRTITVPYAKGDAEGKLTTALIEQLSSSGYFECLHSGGELLLSLVVVSDNLDKIGYRYERHGPTGKRRRHLMPVENRRTVTAQISLIDTRTDALLLEPTKVTADVEYDYIDSNSIRELVFINDKGKPQRTISFSLGQLDAIEGAQDDSDKLVYKRLAQKITEGLIHLDI